MKCNTSTVPLHVSRQSITFSQRMERGLINHLLAMKRGGMNLILPV